MSDAAELEPVIDRILAENPGQVAAYRGGKEGLLGFFVGQVMKETQGKANPRVVNDLVREKLLLVARNLERASRVLLGALVLDERLHRAAPVGLDVRRRGSASSDSNDDQVEKPTITSRSSEKHS